MLSSILFSITSYEKGVIRLICLKNGMKAENNVQRIKAGWSLIYATSCRYRLKLAKEGSIRDNMGFIVFCPNARFDGESKISKWLLFYDSSFLLKRISMQCSTISIGVEINVQSGKKNMAEFIQLCANCSEQSGVSQYSCCLILLVLAIADCTPF